MQNGDGELDTEAVGVSSTGELDTEAAGVGSEYVNCLFDFRRIGKKPGKEKEAQLLVAKLQPSYEIYVGT
jgi:hypothetical protein